MELNKVHVTSEVHKNDEKDGVVGEAVFDFLRSFNRYATKKTAGQGLLDVALLAANVSKLQDLFRRKKRDGVFYALATIICISILLQLIVGLLMAIVGKLNLSSEESRKKANLINNIITVLLTVITFVNVIISVVDITDPSELSK